MTAYPQKPTCVANHKEKLHFLNEADDITGVSHQGIMKPPLARSRQTCIVATLACLVLILLWARCMYSSGSYFLSFRAPSDYGTGNRNLSLFILPKSLADKNGAYCLDGSPPSYYFRKASTTKAAGSWVVVLQGGGWCWNASDCYNRSLTYLGSSYRLPEMIQFEGILSADTNINPEFCDWNIVTINYCDGASFSGNLEAPVMYNNTNIYYRGAPILKLTLAYLLEVVGLKKAERIVLGGLSAGGLAAFIHADYIRSVIPAQIPVHGIVDGGFFLDEKNISGYEHYRFHMREIFNMQNASGSMNKDCLGAMSASEKWKCFFAEYTYPYIKTPLFIINSAYDYWQQWFILDLRCHPIQCPEKLKFLLRHHEIFLNEIGQVYKNSKDGMFISSCFAHVQAVHDNTWTTYQVQGRTPQQAFGDWYFGRTQPAQSRYMDCTAEYDCNPTCAESWTLAFYKNVTDHMKNSTPDF